MNLDLTGSFPSYVVPGIPFPVILKVKNNIGDSGKFWLNYSVDNKLFALLEEVPIGPYEEIIWKDTFPIEWWTYYAEIGKSIKMRFYGGPMGVEPDEDPLDNGPETMSWGPFTVTYGTASKQIPWKAVALVGGSALVGVMAFRKR